MRVVEDPRNRDAIQAITQLIVERFEPDQIILFGSCARGEEDENSDPDLLVVRPVAQAARSLGPAIAGDTSKSSNHPAATTPSTTPSPTTSTSPPTSSSFPRHRPNPDSILSRMPEDTEVLYNRRAA